MFYCKRYYHPSKLTQICIVRFSKCCSLHVERCLQHLSFVEWHTVKFEQTQFANKSCFMFVSFIDFDLPVSAQKVQFREVSSSVQCIYGVIYSWQRSNLSLRNLSFLGNLSLIVILFYNLQSMHSLSVPSFFSAITIPAAYGLELILITSFANMLECFFPLYPFEQK